MVLVAKKPKYPILSLLSRGDAEYKISIVAIHRPSRNSRDERLTRPLLPFYLLPQFPQEKELS